jgi:hypothetical protein
MLYLLRFLLLRPLSKLRLRDGRKVTAWENSKLDINAFPLKFDVCQYTSLHLFFFSLPSVNMHLFYSYKLVISNTVSMRNIISMLTLEQYFETDIICRVEL